ncbi:MAG: Rdx family protein [Gammaproteobacteria bacterium]|nr:Rdx family protein [Gammaproteobacteria bacterium]
MSLELKSENDMEVLLVPGSNGVFDVSVNGRVVFSKNKTGRFPDIGEISELLT